jgi:TRAF3-interacting protein 1
LHDIVVEVNKVTGFANGLYTEFELDSANVSDKDSKINFLQKIINLVGVQLSTLVEAKPAKIVQGSDAQDTNRFLQLLALAARHMPDSTAAVASVKDTMGGSSSAPVAAPPSRPAPPAEEPPRAEEKVRARPQV